MSKELPRRDFLKTVPLVATGTMGGSVVTSAGAFADEPSRDTIREPARDVPVAYDCDVCVVVGSCAGVFAGVAAWLAIDSGSDVAAVDAGKLRATLKKQGAAVI